MIPAATEWGYAPYEVFRDRNDNGAEYRRDRKRLQRLRQLAMGCSDIAQAQRAGRIGGLACDWATSLNSLQNQLPNCALVNLYVAWYGNDLRAGSCTLMPGVTRTSSGEMPHDWMCNGLIAAQAHLVSTVNGAAAFGGTPDDQSVVAAIRDLKGRGLEVCLTPFVLMDIPAGIRCPIPYSGGTGQPVYPWRGRITEGLRTADKSPAGGGGGRVASWRNTGISFCITPSFAQGRGRRGRVPARQRACAA